MMVVIVPVRVIIAAVYKLACTNQRVIVYNHILNNRLHADIAFLKPFFKAPWTVDDAAVWSAEKMVERPPAEKSARVSLPNRPHVPLTDGVDHPTKRAIRSMPSANRMLHMGLPPMEMDVWWSGSVFCMIFPRHKLNRVGERSIPNGHLLLS